MNDSTSAHRIKVRIAEFKVVKGDAVLVAIGLGSCVGVAVYDIEHQVGGMAHILLPGKATKGGNPNKYSESSLDAMLEQVEIMGGRIDRLKAKVVGGANMFPNVSESKKTIGQRNVEAVRDKLSRMNIHIEAEEVGGSEGRTVEFHAGFGKLIIRNAKGEEKAI